MGEGSFSVGRQLVDIETREEIFYNWLGNLKRKVITTFYHRKGKLELDKKITHKLRMGGEIITIIEEPGKVSVFKTNDQTSIKMEELPPTAEHTRMRSV